MKRSEQQKNVRRKKFITNNEPRFQGDTYHTGSHQSKFIRTQHCVLIIVDLEIEVALAMLRQSLLPPRVYEKAGD